MLTVLHPSKTRSPATIVDANSRPVSGGSEPSDWAKLDAIFTWSQLVNLILPWM